MGRDFRSLCFMTFSFSHFEISSRECLIYASYKTDERRHIKVIFIRRVSRSPGSRIACCSRMLFSRHEMVYRDLWKTSFFFFLRSKTRVTRSSDTSRELYPHELAMTRSSRTSPWAYRVTRVRRDNRVLDERNVRHATLWNVKLLRLIIADSLAKKNIKTRLQFFSFYNTISFCFLEFLVILDISHALMFLESEGYRICFGSSQSFIFDAPMCVESKERKQDWMA